MALDILATALRRQRPRTPSRPFTDEWPELDLDTAYAIQDAALQRRVERGETVVGVKLGLTTRAKQQRMGIDSPLTAWLTDAHGAARGRARCPWTGSSIRGPSPRSCS